MGLTSSGSLVSSPLHRHQVDIDIHRAELAISHMFANEVDLQLRIPYFIKDQTSSIEFLEQATAEQSANARRNSDIHHRTERYEGFGDAEFTVGWRSYGLLTDDDTLRIGLGLTIPFGSTEENPWRPEEAGLEHLHIQFGNGTVDPIIDLYYGHAFNDRWAASLFAKTRLPFYENSKGYQGSIEAVISPGIQFRPSPRLSLSGGLTGNYLGRSQWSETGTDPNSGAFLAYASLGAGYIFGDAVTGSLSVNVPIYSDLFGEEDGLDAAPIISLSISRQF